MSSTTTRSPKSGKTTNSVKVAKQIAYSVMPLTFRGYDNAKPLKGPKAFEVFRQRYQVAPVNERVLIERTGLPSEVVKVMIADIGLSDADFQRTVRIPKATYAKKMKEGARFDGTVGQSAIHIMELVNKVDEMVRVDPDPNAIKDFDAAKWVGEWIRTPQPGLGGSTPAELLDTPSGRESVMRLLGSIQSGAYQ